MPQIEGADFSSISTDFEVYEAGTYKVRITEVEYNAPGALEGRRAKEHMIVKGEITDAPNNALVGKPFSEYIGLQNNDGKSNEFGWKQVKRYFEAVLGKEEASRLTSPDTDLLVNGEVQVVLAIDEFEGTKRNKVKRVLAA